MNDTVMCTCGHAWRAHDHYRANLTTDCSAICRCPQFRRWTWWRKLRLQPW